MIPMHDEVLVEAALRGSCAAFETLVRRYRPQVTRIAYRITRNAESADDVAQEAFMHAFIRLGKLQPDRSFSRWLFVIARNCAIDVMRRRKRFASLSLPITSTDRSPEDVVIEAEAAIRVRAVIEALPQRYSEALTLYYIAGLPYREIAERLGLPINTVKTNISRGKQRLRENIHATTAAA
jgi:RNA polymerase sigma-70 factor (ECF subfamily)